MNKNELISAIAENAGLTKVDAKKALDGFINVTTEALKKGDKIALIGFGTFDVVERQARVGLNPKTKEKIQIPAKKVIKFKPGADLK
ncbi:MAG: HU family DNA-binding protein [Bacteroidales bacterium]|nr:HU family DNA-binding protein [Bacteroidales bacterium]